MSRQSVSMPSIAGCPDKRRGGETSAPGRRSSVTSSVRCAGRRLQRDTRLASERSHSPACRCSARDAGQSRSARFRPRRATHRPQRLRLRRLTRRRGETQPARLGPHRLTKPRRVRPDVPEPLRLLRDRLRASPACGRRLVRRPRPGQLATRRPVASSAAGASPSLSVRSPPRSSLGEWDTRPMPAELTGTALAGSHAAVMRACSQRP